MRCIVESHFSFPVLQRRTSVDSARISRSAKSFLRFVSMDLLVVLLIEPEMSSWNQKWFPSTMKEFPFRRKERRPSFAKQEIEEIFGVIWANGTPTSLDALVRYRIDQIGVRVIEQYIKCMLHVSAIMK